MRLISYSPIDASFIVKMDVSYFYYEYPYIDDFIYEIDKDFFKPDHNPVNKEFEKLSDIIKFVEEEYIKFRETTDVLLENKKILNKVREIKK